MKEKASKRTGKTFTIKPPLIVKKRPRPRFTFNHVAGTFANQVFRMFRVKTGLMGCTCFSMAWVGVTVFQGPYIENEYIRYALAGTVATVAVEFGTHAFDTVNMRSKAVEGDKKLLINMFKLEGIASLFRGVQAVIYGYAFSSMIYFYAYAGLRD